MGTGYTRNDTANNIADGNIINASDLDGEFDAIQSAMATGGHTHDGTAAEGGPITVIGPVQDFIASGTDFKPKGTGYSLGTSGAQFTDLYIDGTAYIDGLGESILVDSASKIQFRDSALFINSSADGQLDLEADTTIELTAPTVALTNDLSLQSDGAILNFGEHDEVTVTHVHNTGLDVKAAGGIDLNLQTSETSVETGNVLGKITFNSPNETATGSSVVAGAAIEAVAEATFASNNNSSALVFKTNTDGAATERMRIKSDGNISLTGATTISNTSGDLTLDIVGELIIDTDLQGEGNGILLKDDGIIYGNIFRTSSDLVLMSVASDEDLIFKGNDGGSTITALTLDMSEAGAATFNDLVRATKVGIGMAPTEMLDITSASGDARIRLDAPTGSDTEIKFFNNGSAQFTIGHDDGTDAFIFGLSNVDDPKVAITKAGYLGIGTTAPAALLEIKSTSTVAGAILTTTAGSDSEIEFRNTNSGNHTWAIGQDFSNSRAFSIAYANALGASLSSNSKFIIDTGGNVGIGVIPENSSGTWRNFEQGGMNLAARANNAVDGMIGTNYVFETDNSEVYKTSAATSRIFFDANELKFQQAASGTAGNTITWSTSMVIKEDGDLGIGTDSPDFNLSVLRDTSEVYSSTGFPNATGHFKKYNNSGLANEYSSIRLQVSANNGSTNAQAAITAIKPSNTTNATDLAFQTRATDGTIAEAMRIDSNSRIGMGVTPLGIAGYTKGQLELGSNDGGILILTDSNTTTDKKRKFIAGKGTGFKFGRADDSGTVTSDTDFTVDSTGKVGIGTATPGVLFGVTGEGSGVFISTIENTHATNGSGLKVKAGDDNNVSTFRAVDKDNTTLFDVNSGGNVGIGTSFPQAVLQIGDSGGTSTSRQRSLRISHQTGQSSDYGGIEFFRAHQNSEKIGASIIHERPSTSLDDSNLVFKTSSTNADATERMKITHEGNVEITDGNLVVASGHGIDFSATGDGSGTMSNELLDDYEEGTWTPVLTHGYASPTYDIQMGYYTKIGNIVRAYFRVKMNGGTPNSNNVIIGGLPYTSLTDGSQYPVGTGYVNLSAAYADVTMGLQFQASTVVRLYRRTTTANATLTGNDLGNSLDILYQVIYMST